MSYELYLYSPSPEPPERSILETALRDEGWEVHFCPDAGEIKTSAEGRLQDDLVIGWRLDSPHAASARRHISESDQQALDELYKSNAVGSCEIYISPFSPDEEWQEQAEALSGLLTADAIRQIGLSTLHYTIRTKAGRNDASFELQDLVAGTLSKTAQSWLEDPQAGTWKNPDGQGTALSPTRGVVQESALKLAFHLIKDPDRLFRWLVGILIAAALIWLATM